MYYKVEKDKKEEQVIEPKKEERETTSDRTKIENLQIDNSQSSWWSSWSGLSKKFSNSPKGEKRNWGELSCEEEEENCWDSFKSSQKNLTLLIKINT